MQAQWIASVSLVVLGVALFAMGRWPKRKGDVPRCRRCEYDVSAGGSEVCPDCGHALRPAGVVVGTRHRRRDLIVIGLMLGVGGLSLAGRNAAESIPQWRERIVSNEVLIRRMSEKDRNRAFNAASELLRRSASASAPPAALSSYLLARFDDFNADAPITSAERFFVSEIRSNLQRWGAQDEIDALYPILVWPWLRCPRIACIGDTVLFRCPTTTYTAFRIISGTYGGATILPPSAANQALYDEFPYVGGSFVAKAGVHELRVRVRAEQEQAANVLPSGSKALLERDFWADIRGLPPAEYEGQVKKELRDIFDVCAWWPSGARGAGRLTAALIVVRHPVPLGGSLAVAIEEDERWRDVTTHRVEAGYFGLLYDKRIYPNVGENPGSRRVRLTFSPDGAMPASLETWAPVEYVVEDVPYSANFAAY